MEVSTLDSSFKRKDVIDQFTSCVWTERYSEPGDFTLAIPYSTSTDAMLPLGGFVSIAESNEVMLIETRSVENGVLTVSGPSLLDFLQYRIVRIDATESIKTWRLYNMTPGNIIGTIVDKMCIEATANDTNGRAIGISGTSNNITKLILGAIDTSDSAISISIDYGSVYDAIKSLADQYSLGLSLYLARNGAYNLDYNLMFTTYKGRDLTSTQSTYDLVRFAPAVDSLTNTKELRSLKGYRNVAYAFAGTYDPNYGPIIPPGVAYSPGVTDATIDFARRPLMVWNDDVTYTNTSNNLQTVAALLLQTARDALANNNFTKVFDGEVVPQNQYVFGKNYKLGDIIELQSLSGLNQRARVTEYIRSQDNSGKRAYPTVSVLT